MRITGRATGTALFLSFVLATEMTGRILARMGRIPESGAEEAIQAAMQACADWVENDAEMGRIVVMNGFGNPVLLTADLQSRDRFMRWFRSRTEGGVERGEPRFDAAREPRSMEL